MTTNQQSEYRAFLLDNSDRIVRRFDFEADDHGAALEHAKQYVDGHLMKSRTAARLAPSSSVPPITPTRCLIWFGQKHMRRSNFARESL